MSKKRKATKPPKDVPSPKRQKIDKEEEWGKAGRIYVKIEWSGKITDVYFINVNPELNYNIYQRFMKIMTEEDLNLEEINICKSERFTYKEVAAFQHIQPYTKLKYTVTIIDKLYGHLVDRLESFQRGGPKFHPKTSEEIEKSIKYIFRTKKVVGYF